MPMRWCPSCATARSDEAQETTAEVRPCLHAKQRGIGQHARMETFEKEFRAQRVEKGTKVDIYTSEETRQHHTIAVVSETHVTFHSPLVRQRWPGLAKIGG